MINSITLKNFKCFEKQTIPLNNLTLLTGLNGMGKSTVIQSLLLLRQTNDQNTLSMGNQNGIGLVLNGELVSIGIGQDILYGNAEKEVVEISLKTDNRYSSSWEWNYERDADFLQLASCSVDTATLNTSLFNDNFQYLNAERLGPRTSLKTSYFSVRSKRHLGIHGEHVLHYISQFAAHPIPIPKLLHPSDKTNTLKNQIEAWMELISPGTRLVLKEHTDIDLVSLRYQFSNGREVTNEFRPTNVGFGITNVLPVITAILSASPGTLLLIENPEAHLHPQGQFEIGRLISIAAEHGVQIIVETHSDHILNGIRVATKNKEISSEKTAVHFFHKDNNYKHVITTPTLDSEGRFDNWPDNFFDEWDKSLDQLL